jgi:hypothetical protein
MKHVAISLLTLLLFCFAGLLPLEHANAQPGKMAPTLARAGLGDATTAAKKWKPDAILVQVEGHVTGDAGTTPMWQYGFYSPAAKMCALVFVNAGRTHVSEAGGEECKAAELKEFMDSDQALKLARTNGVTALEVAMVVHAEPAGQGARAVWTLMDERGMKSGNVIVDIDAKTGAVLNKITQH